MVYKTTEKFRLQLGLEFVVFVMLVQAPLHRAMKPLVAGQLLIFTTEFRLSCAQILQHERIGGGKYVSSKSYLLVI